MATTKIAYAASAAATITLASLGTSANMTAGRQSTAIDNTSNLYLDYLLSGKVTVGTTPTISTEIRVYVVALQDDSTWPDTFGASDAAVTVTSIGVATGIWKLAAVMGVDSTTSNRTYPFGPVSVASLYGGSCPSKFVVWIAHNTAVNLNSTGSNHAVYTKGVYATTA